jgi:HTH-type transcriptional regulator/antitoxin HigA
MHTEKANAKRSVEIVDRHEYAHLLSEVLPHLIHSEAENERYSAVLETLLRKKKRTAEEKRLEELLTLLIEEYEEKRFAVRHPAGSIDILRNLMDANGLRQVDLLDAFGTASGVSEVLSGKRDLSKTHILKLSQRFHVSRALFF